MSSRTPRRQRPGTGHRHPQPQAAGRRRSPLFLEGCGPVRHLRRRAFLGQRPAHTRRDCRAFASDEGAAAAAAISSSHRQGQPRPRRPQQHVEKPRPSAYPPVSLLESRPRLPADGGGRRRGSGPGGPVQDRSAQTGTCLAPTAAGRARPAACGSLASVTYGGFGRCLARPLR